MTERPVWIVIPVLALLVASSLGCGKKLGPSNLMTLSVETFTGTIAPLGQSSHTFYVNYELDYTNASVQLTSLTRVSNGTIPTITVGLAFGSPVGGGCDRGPSYQSPRSPLNQVIETPDWPFRNGTYCVQIYDNPDAPTITEPMSYTLVVRHY